MARALVAFRALFKFYLIFGLGWTAGCLFEAFLMVALIRKGG